MTELAQVGEIRLIRKIRNMIGPPYGGLKVGSGDDCALFAPPSKDLLATKDLLVEGVHFDFKTSTPFIIGWNAMAANLSDIAAMGGSPLYALVGISSRPDIETGKIISIVRGMIKISKIFGCQIAGGDLVSTRGPLTISITIIGISSGKKRLRSNARPGDRILVTGWPGASALALKEKRAIKIIPRLKEIKYLSRKIRINALIDLSDGLSSDLTRICEESGAGAVIFEKFLPVAGELKKINQKDRLLMVLNGGEDFELLMTTPEKQILSLRKKFEKQFKIPITFIGEIMPKREGIKIIGKDGKIKNLKAGGYEHFKKHNTLA